MSDIRTSKDCDNCVCGHSYDSHINSEDIQGGCGFRDCPCGTYRPSAPQRTSKKLDIAPFYNCTFSGQPPAPYTSWSEWAASGTYTGVVIRSTLEPRAEEVTIQELAKRLRQCADITNYGRLEDLQEALHDLASDLDSGAFGVTLPPGARPPEVEVDGLTLIASVGDYVYHCRIEQKVQLYRTPTKCAAPVIACGLCGATGGGHRPECSRA